MSKTYSTTTTTILLYDDISTDPNHVHNNNADNVYNILITNYFNHDYNHPLIQI